MLFGRFLLQTYSKNSGEVINAPWYVRLQCSRIGGFGYFFCHPEAKMGIYSSTEQYYEEIIQRNKKQVKNLVLDTLTTLVTDPICKNHANYSFWAYSQTIMVVPSCTHLYQVGAIVWSALREKPDLNFTAVWMLWEHP